MVEDVDGITFAVWKDWLYIRINPFDPVYMKITKEVRLVFIIANCWTKASNPDSWLHHSNL